MRSSATAEDLPSASFAGQQQTDLNVRGEPALLDAVRNCMAALFTDRAIVYRTERGFAHESVALSVGVQKMVRSDLGSAGVIFTLDTETGVRDVVLITGAYGLGETVVQGRGNPDQYWVHEPTLIPNDVILAEQFADRPLPRRRWHRQHLRDQRRLAEGGRDTAGSGRTRRGGSPADGRRGRRRRWPTTHGLILALDKGAGVRRRSATPRAPFCNRVAAPQLHLSLHRSAAPRKAAREARPCGASPAPPPDGTQRKRLAQRHGPAAGPFPRAGARDRTAALARRVHFGPVMDNMDSVIEREVNAAITANRSICAAPLSVVVDAGVVKLSGVVRSPAESLAAQQAAFGVPGVIDVINGLDARVPGGAVRSDADVAHAVRHALVWNALVPDEVISSNVTNGIVRLHGTVDDTTERDEAERSVCHLPGVRRVHNLLTVRPREETMRAVVDAIETAVDLDADAGARRIEVDVREGRAILSGVVRCAEERDAIVSAAGHTAGVRAVTDRLRLVGAA